MPHSTARWYGPTRGATEGRGTGRRAGGTRRGGRRLSEGQGWSAQRQAYEVGLALEWVVRQVEIEEVGGSGEIGEIFYWNNPFLLPSLPSMPPRLGVCAVHPGVGECVGRRRRTD